MAKRGRKPIKIDLQKMIQLIEDDKVNPYVMDLAKAANCSYYTMRKFVINNPELQAAIDLSKTQIIDKSEKTLNELLDDPDPKIRAGVAKWITSVRNDKYLEKSKIEVEGTINNNIVINIKREDEDDLKDLLENND